MSKGCPSCLNIICLRKKQRKEQTKSKKQHKLVKTEDVVEPVGVIDDEEETWSRRQTSGEERDTANLNICLVIAICLENIEEVILLHL
ncbi:unnamed protein product [Arabidopsis halleri]